MASLWSENICSVLLLVFRFISTSISVRMSPGNKITELKIKESHFEAVTASLQSCSLHYNHTKRKREMEVGGGVSVLGVLERAGQKRMTKIYIWKGNGCDINSEGL